MHPRSLVALLLICLFSTKLLWAQDESVHGTVKDSNGEPIALAVVLTVSPKDSSIVAHTVTNMAGFFRVKAAIKGNFWLQIHQMGYITQTKVVELPTNVAQDFVLKDDPKEIEAVRIGGKRKGMVRKGDTIGYNLKAYATGMEKTLGDVLANLPGIKVGADGSVMAQGKEVSKILFNGRDYFGDNVAMATKNIEANVADTVKVVEGYSEYDIFRGFQNIDKTVIDVGVKEDKLSKIRGSLELGGGYKNAYLGKGQFYYMGTNNMFSATIASNNVAVGTFTLMDYLAMQGGLESPEGGMGVTFSMAGTLAPIMNPPKDTYKAISHAVNLLYNYHRQKKIKITAAAMVAKGGNEQKTEQRRIFLAGAMQGDAFTTGSQQSTEVAHAMANMGVTLNITDNLMLLTSAAGDFGYALNTDIYDDYYASLVNTKVKTYRRPFSWTTKGGVYYKMGEHLLYLVNNVQTRVQRPIYNINASSLILPLEMQATKDGRYLLQFLNKQTRNVANTKLGTRLKLSENHELKVYLSHSYDRSSNWSNFEGEGSISLRNGFVGDMTTDLRFQEHNSALGIRWSFNKKEHLWCSAELSGHYLQQKAIQPQRIYSNAEFYIEPMLHMNYQITPDMFLRLWAASNIRTQDPARLAYGMQMNSYRSITQNHDYARLYDRDYRSWVRWRYDPTEKSYSLNAGLRFTRKASPYSQFSQYGLLSVSMPFGVTNSDTWAIDLGASKRLWGTWTFSTDLAWNYDVSDIRYNERVSKSISQGPTVGLEAKSAYSSYFNTTIGLQGERTVRKVSDFQTLVDYFASAKATCLFTYQKFRAELSGSYSLSAYSGKNPQLFGLDAELSYDLFYGISLLLRGTNLLNITKRQWVDISYSDLFRTERLYRAMPGYAMLVLRWEIGRKDPLTSSFSRRFPARRSSTIKATKMPR